MKRRKLKMRVPELQCVKAEEKRAKFVWTSDVDSFIKKYYKTKGCNWVAEKLKAPYRIVQSRALKSLKISKFSQVGWTAEQDSLLQVNYPRHGAPYTATLLGLSVTAVQKRASTLGCLYEPKDRYVQKDGYVVIGKEGNRMFEHRYVMEQKLGRKLKPDEIVHHIDEVKSNNDPDNLALTNRTEHLDTHRKRKQV